MYRLPFLPSMIAICCVLLLSCCGGGDDPLPVDNQQQGSQNTLQLAAPQSGGSTGGADFSVPAGVTVTSASVSGGSIELGVTDLSQSMSEGFEGTVYGGASFTPADASFSEPVSVSIPVFDAGSSVNVYYVSGASSVSAAGYSLHAANIPVTNGKASFTTSRFGSFICGMAGSQQQQEEEEEQQEEQQHNEGGGSSL